MIVQVILIRILEFKILKGIFKIISSKQVILQMRKVGLRRPHDLLKALQLTSIPWDWDRNLQVLVQSWGSREHTSKKQSSEVNTAHFPRASLTQ